ncbi:MAG: ABC transporter permease subunit [Chloroflexota bacterium]
MTVIAALVAMTLRGLLSRRRAILMLLLVLLPVLVGLLLRIAGGSRDAPEILDTLVIRTVLPLVALIVGTAAIGSEVEDGTIVFLVTKPIARWKIALTKLVVAAGLTVALVVPPMLLTGALVGGLGGASLGVAFGFALAAMAGGTAYAFLFTALGAITSRALILGLGYTLLWEGVLAGLLEGTRFLSVRQATLGVASTLSGESIGRSTLDGVVAVVILVGVIAASAALTSLALDRFQVRSGD